MRLFYSRLTAALRSVFLRRFKCWERRRGAATPSNARHVGWGEGGGHTAFPKLKCFTSGLPLGQARARSQHSTFLPYPAPLIRLSLPLTHHRPLHRLPPSSSPPPAILHHQTPLLRDLLPSSHHHQQESFTKQNRKKTRPSSSFAADSHYINKKIKLTTLA